MYAHVNTYRLGSSEETEREMAWALNPEAEGEGRVINDQAARTIASWWHSPRQEAIVALSHGRPFDTDKLREEIEREITEENDSSALLAWLDALEVGLAD